MQNGKLVLHLLSLGAFTLLIERSCTAEPSSNWPSYSTYVKHSLDITERYRPVANKILQYFLKGRGKTLAYNRLTNITDTFGHRLSGSKALNDTIDHLIETLKAEGFHSYTEPVEITGWKRGNETAELRKPRWKPLKILGLGYTTATPPEGILADAVVVKSFDELHQLPRSVVEGKIVVFNQEWINYSFSADYRVSGANEAAKLGAVAALVRSVTSMSIYSPHTGFSYQPAVPVASLTVEDAQMLYRLYKSGEQISIFLRIDSNVTEPIYSRNTIAELQGHTLPREYVLVSGHLDSWDVGTGAMDDLSGVIISWMALTAMRDLDLTPKRTVRAVFWTGEEQGHVGSQQYYQQHKTWHNETFRLVMESDLGAFKPSGLNFTGSAASTQKMQQIMKLLKPIYADQLSPCNDGGDVGWWQADGVPMGCYNTMAKPYDYYFMFHHTEGDSPEVYNPQELDYAAALWTVVAYVVADIDQPL